MALALSSCAHNGPVSKAELCLEIPFVDGAEAACAHTITRKTRLIGAKEWKEERPYYLMIHAKYWTDIKLDWLKACRLAGPDCNVAVKSIDDLIQALDKILKQVLPKP